MKKIFVLALACFFWCCASDTTTAQSFFYIGPANGDFFDETNWNSLADGSGVNAGAGTINPGTSILLDLVMDGDAVDAAGTVQFGAGGGLTTGMGAILNVTGANNQLDFLASSDSFLNDSTFNVQDDISLLGNIDISGSAFVSIDDDVEFDGTAQNVNASNSSFTSGDNTYFDEASTGTMDGVTIFSADRLGLRGAGVAITINNADININNGAGDVEDVFATNDALGATLTLTGNSVLLADQLQENTRLILEGSTVATLANVADADELSWIDSGALLTVNSLNAQLVLQNSQTDDARSLIINGLTGMTYLEDPSTWNIANWNGTDAATLSLIPEPSGTMLLLAGITGLAARRRKS